MAAGGAETFDDEGYISDWDEEEQVAIAQNNELEKENEDRGWNEMWIWEDILDNLNEQLGEVLCGGESVICEALRRKIKLALEVLARYRMEIMAWIKRKTRERKERGLHLGMEVEIQTVEDRERKLAIDALQQLKEEESRLIGGGQSVSALQQVRGSIALVETVLRSIYEGAILDNKKDSMATVGQGHDRSPWPAE